MKQYAFAFFRLTALLLFACGFAGEVRAQQEITCQVKIYNKADKDTIKETMWAREYASVEKAQEAVRKIRKLLSGGSSDLNYDDKKARQQERFVRDEFKRSKSNRNGEYIFPGFSGMAVVMLTTDFDAVKMFRIVEGKTHYVDTVQVSRIKQVIKDKKRKRAEYDQVSVIDYGDGYENFVIKAILPEGLAKDDSRLIFQIYAVDCLTDDTVDYLMPKVFEGADYHVLQNKRKNYDYDQYDPLAIGFDDSDTLRGGKKKYIQTSVKWKKPDKKKKYRGPYTYSIEDYHHSYYTKNDPGTCLRISPFKFMDFSVAEASLELDREKFYEEPKIGIDTIPQDLYLNFQVGKAILRDDSTNQRLLYELREQLDAVQLLLSGKVVAYVSPEGGVAVNEPLVRRRAETARNIIHKYMKGRHLEEGYHVYTWEETADLVEKNGHKEVADAMREALSKHGAAGTSREVDRARDAAMRHVEGYEEFIVPVMESQRKLTFTYLEQLEKVKNPREALEAYEKNPKGILSWGDYYNVFDQLGQRYARTKSLEDSLKLDQLTRFTYQRVLSNSDWESIKMAPYIINQMALIQNRVAPDTMILKKLIVDTLQVNAKKVLDFNTGTSITINCPEFILNQAVGFFKLQEILRAKQMLQMVKQNLMSYDDNVREAVKRLDYFITFKEQLPNKKRTEEQEKDFKEALNFIENSGTNNRAILYTELPEELDKEDDEALKWVNIMDDDNPQKWYLKGILAARNVDKQQALEVDEQAETVLNNVEQANKGVKLMPGDYENLDINRMGHYLAYFQHAFDMEQKLGKKDMLRYYFNEGHVEDRVRKKYPYKNALIPVYREIFRMRQPLDDDAALEAFDELDSKFNLEDLGINVERFTKKPKSLSNEKKNDNE